MAPNTTPTKPFPFLRLPPEIREQIYRHVLYPSNFRIPTHGDHPPRMRYDLRLLRVSRLIHAEALKIFREENLFVRIETPWEEAEQHIEDQGRVGFVIRNGPLAEAFEGMWARVIVDARWDQSTEVRYGKFVVLVEDLEGFTNMWFYNAITHAALNPQLRLTIRLEDPWGRGEVPREVQRRIFEPFGKVKNLESVKIVGEANEGLVKAMREEMEKPYRPAEECLDEGIKLKDAGNEALKQGKYQEAIDLYLKSFHAIHIVCEGRRRHVYAEQFFDQELKSGTHKGQHGQIVRLVLRIRLVANIVLAYLKLEDWDEARFWGQRTLNHFNQAMGGEEIGPQMNFVAAAEIGKIYYRTGIAYKALGDESDARRLLRIAAMYLPHDEKVKTELASVALKLG